MDILDVVAEAKQRSPLFAGTLSTIYRDGYTYSWNTVDRKTYTNTAQKMIVISPFGTRDEVLVRIMYEAGNALFGSDFAKITKMRDAGKFSNGDQYARAMLREETATVVNSSRSALEAGLVYDAIYDGIVARFLRADPSSARHLIWKKGKSVNDAINALFPRIVERAMTTDANGNRVLARQSYADDWRAWSLLQKRGR